MEAVQTRLDTTNRSFFLSGSPKIKDSETLAADEAVASAGSLVITGPASGDGTVYLYVGGNLVEVAVTDADDVTAIGDALVSAVGLDATVSALVTCVNTTGTVAVTAVTAGTAGDSITLAINSGGESLPAGVGVSITAMAGGDDGATEDLVKRTLMAKNPATNKWVPHTSLTATDGTEVPRGILNETIAAADLLAGDVSNVQIIVGGPMEFAEDLLIMGDTFTYASEITNQNITIEDALYVIGLYPESVDAVSELENS